MSSPLSGTVPGDGPLVLIHGGAWDIPDDGLAEHLDGLTRALRVARRAFEHGRSALAIAVETVAALEDHPAFDAGRGAVLDRDGLPQLDAGVMDGTDLRWGAVANVRRVKNPVRLAQALLSADGQARLLVAEGAERFAAEVGLPSVSPQSLIVDRERARYERLTSTPDFHTSAAFSGEMDVPRGTVGCVVRDAEGRVAAATSTGGAPLTRSGRVGDSPIPGAGFYADARGAASTTGWGEAILTTQLAARSVGADPEATAAAALADMAARVVWPGARVATGGVIALNAAGVAGWAFSTPRMARGWWRPGGEATVAVER
ncbi:isoaspartyl peptidase/L-asparaginase family protein [Rubrivirga sp. IMCC45206]|uniref:isoaspartyl peptidase/L-asparaginase family protein n=1 Tax=Rubrivirga sp. IMCC45206 TaxID=3391614 RepID=UPI0039901B87